VAIGVDVDGGQQALGSRSRTLRGEGLAEGELNCAITASGMSVSSAVDGLAGLLDAVV
jgi:hypothetical protein